MGDSQESDDSWETPAVDWTAFLQEDVLSAPVMAAFLVLLGVIITAYVTTRIAEANRLSAEETAADRLEAEQRQGALDRSFSDRAKTYLEARKWLRTLDDLTARSMLDAVWRTDDWDSPFARADREELRNKIEIYGTTNAAQLFDATASAFETSGYEKRSARDTLVYRQDKEREQEGEDAEKRWQYHQSTADRKGADYHNYGHELLKKFTQLCQEDLSDTGSTDEEFSISPIDRSHNAQIERQRYRKIEGLPAVEGGEEELLDWGD